VEPRANDGNLLGNVLAHTWDLGKHKEDEETGCSAEVRACGCPVSSSISLQHP
jgi:hypothetical protein